MIFYFYMNGKTKTALRFGERRHGRRGNARLFAGTCLLAVLLLPATAMLLGTGCGRPETVLPSGDAISHVSGKEFSFTNRHEIIPEKFVDESRDVYEHYIVADFNANGLMDVAVMENVTDDMLELVVYVQATPEQVAQAIGPESGVTLAEQAGRHYFRAGRLQRPLEGRFAGLASRRSGKYTDLLILLQHDSSSEILHYRNDGSRFFEVDAQGAKPAVTAPVRP